MPSQAYNYNINKYSVYKSDTNSWYHYPQRTNLSVTFVYNGDQADQIDVIVHWKAQIWYVYSFLSIVFSYSFVFVYYTRIFN